MSQTAALARLVVQAKAVTVFTGAGISTESGIPDFRSPGGVWSRIKPIPFQDFVAKLECRREAWTRVYSNSTGWVGAKPNAGHFGVARLAAAGKLTAVITQNVDSLHQDSGLSDEQVIELHGNAGYIKCLDCGQRSELADYRQAFLDHGVIPECGACGGVVKTATISFGQSMPALPMARAKAATLACDLFLVLGSSLVVYPAAAFPVMAKQRGAKLVIVNREPTDQDSLADVVIHDSIGEVMTAVQESLITSRFDTRQ